MPTEQEILEALKQVEDPDLHRDIVSLGFISDVNIRDGRVDLRIVLTTPACPVRDQLKAQVEEILQSLPDVQEVNVTMDAEVRSSQPTGNARPVEGVRNIIAIASNKGGVGKSTVAVNLAVALAKRGARVGLLDADVTGPNIPIMMGFEAGFMAEGEGERGLSTVEKYGVRMISLGFVLPRLSPVVWRGPMVGTAVRQLLHDIRWGEVRARLQGVVTAVEDHQILVMASGQNWTVAIDGEMTIQAQNGESRSVSDLKVKDNVEVLGTRSPDGTIQGRRIRLQDSVQEGVDIEDDTLDYLLIDLPPGTSDASMSMAQEAPISGVVIVSTPQDVAWEDAGKAVAMFDKLNVPVFGVIENMSYFLCPHCGERTEIFGHGGGKKAAEELGLEFLGEVPLDIKTRVGGDTGVPVVESDPDSTQGQAFIRLAEQVAARCSTLSFVTSGVV